ERHYQLVFYLIAKLMGQFTEAEVHSARGRSDMVIKTDRYIYVFEFKLTGSAKKALVQIDDQGYLIPYTVDGRELIKVGANFSKKKRNVDKWLVG
ncbi:MAG: PD-(D/E)XK nuclease domain-containing protein, partial [Bacteroidales bacterium]